MARLRLPLLTEFGNAKPFAMAAALQPAEAPRPRRGAPVANGAARVLPGKAARGLRSVLLELRGAWLGTEKLPPACRHGTKVTPESTAWIAATVSTAMFL